MRSRSCWKIGPHRIERLRARPPLAGAAALGEGRQDAVLVVLQLLANRRHRFFFGLPRARLPAERLLPPPAPALGSYRAACPDGHAAARVARARSAAARVCPGGVRDDRRRGPGARSWWRARCPCSTKSTLRRATLTDWTSTLTASPSANVRPERRPDQPAARLVVHVVVVGQLRRCAPAPRRTARRRRRTRRTRRRPRSSPSNTSPMRSRRKNARYRSITSRSTSIAARSENDASAAIFCSATRSGGGATAARLEPARRLPLPGQPRLQQPVHEQVRVAPDRRREVQVVPRRQPEVAEVHDVVGRLLQRAQHQERQRLLGRVALEPLEHALQPLGRARLVDVDGDAVVLAPASANSSSRAAIGRVVDAPQRVLAALVEAGAPPPRWRRA